MRIERSFDLYPVNITARSPYLAEVVTTENGVTVSMQDGFGRVFCFTTEQEIFMLLDLIDAETSNGLKFSASLTSFHVNAQEEYVIKIRYHDEPVLEFLALKERLGKFLDYIMTMLPNTLADEYKQSD